MPTPPILTDATDEFAGRPCPYCQTAVATGEAAARCGDCAAVHHAECWTENDGCAIPGCVSAPDPNAVPQAVVGVGAAEAAPTRAGRLAISLSPDGSDTMTAVREEAPVLAPMGLPEPRRRRWPMVVTVLVVVGLIAGTVAALSSTGSTSSETPSPGQPGGAPSGDASGLPQQATLGACAEQPDAEATPERFAGLMASYLNAIQDGKKDDAFACLSAKAQAWFANGDASAAQSHWWATQQQLKDGLGTQGAATLLVSTGSLKSMTNDPPTYRFHVPRAAWNGGSCEPGGWMWASKVESGGREMWALEPAIEPYTTANDSATRLDKATVKAADPAPSGSFYPACLTR